MRLPVNRALPLAALILLSAGAAAARDGLDKPAAPVTGPAADYPVVVGKPYTIGTTVWTPTDQLNYDAVGNAAVGDADLAGITAAHKTLPLPSYAEVTALDTGKTILVRIERRGPMVNDRLIELSPGAASQLGIAAGHNAPVRVRRVNPPEQERAMLRSASRAPERMETPEGLLKALRRKLADQSPLLPPSSTPPAMPIGAPPYPAVTDNKSASKSGASKLAGAQATPAKTPSAQKATTRKPESAPAAPKVDGPTAKPEQAKSGAASAAKTGPAQNESSLLVQVAALSVEANAHKLASQLGGSVSRTGRLWRVRMGPFANRAQAAAALEKAKHAGYSDARIQSAD